MKLRLLHEVSDRLVKESIRRYLKGINGHNADQFNFKKKKPLKKDFLKIFKEEITEYGSSERTHIVYGKNIYGKNFLKTVTNYYGEIEGEAELAQDAEFFYKKWFTGDFQ